jgi:hypothetical protein
MTETERIRWSEEIPGQFTGYTGTLRYPSLFHIYRPYRDCDDIWVLTSRLPGMERERYSGNDGDGPEELKAEADRWLVRFATSLGASFRQPGAGCPRCHLTNSGRWQIEEARALC